MLKEFKEFAMRGNVIDLAVGIIIGAAFGRIVTSLVNDIIMPPIGLLMGNVDFSNLFVNLDMSQSFASVAEAEAAGAPIIKYGLFINTLLDFVIVAFAIFLVIRTVKRVKVGHVGGPLSAADILAALYGRILRIRPTEPDWPDRDRFILSKGHSSLGQYAALALAGYFSTDELAKSWFAR